MPKNHLPFSEAEAELLDDFLAEAREQLQNIEEDILGLEENPNNFDLLNKVLRSVHTIKGDSGFFGLENIVSLSHAMEDILMKCRDKELKLTKAMISVLLKGGDTLVKMIQKKDLGKKTNVKTIIKNLHKFLPKTERELANQEETELFVAKTQELPIYKILFSIESFYESIDSDSIGNGLTGYLENFGTLVDCSVSPEELNRLHEGNVEMLYQSSMPMEILEFSLRQASDRIELFDNFSKPLDIIEISNETDDDFDIDENEDQIESNNSKETSDENSFANIKTVRVNIKLLDKLMNLAGEIVLGRNQLLRQFKDEKNDSVLTNLSMRISELQENVMNTRLQPVGSVFSKFKRIVRDICEKLNKKIKLEISGGNVEVDRSIVEALQNPLTHLIRNSIDHAIEYCEERLALNKPTYGTISLKAYHESGQVIIEVQDDGRGLNIASIKKKIIDKGLLTIDEVDKLSSDKISNYIFLPGFSTASNVSELSGRGVGMDVVKSTFEKFGGNMEISTAKGKGTTIRIKLPLTLAIVSCLIFSVNKELFAIPQIEIQEVVQIRGTNINQQIEFIENAAVFRLRNRLVPVINFKVLLEQMDTNSRRKETLQKDVSDDSTIKNLMILKSGKNEFGLLVDEIIDTEEVVVKQLPSLIRNCNIYSGTTITGNGSVIMIIDIEGIIKDANLDFMDLKDKLLEFEIENKDEENSRKTDRHLCFYNDSKEIFSVSLSQVQRIEKIKQEQIMHIGNREYVTLRGKQQFFLRISDYLPVSPIDSEQKEFYLIIPHQKIFSVGILVSEIMDTVDIRIEDIEKTELDTAGIEGTYLYNNRLNLVINLEKLIKNASSDFNLIHN